MKMLWRPTSGNAKTGNIPQGYVGETKQQTETSCAGCKWRRKDPETGKGGGCYYWQGQTQGAHESMRVRERRHPDEYTLTYALKNARRAARYVRAAVGGDPNVFSRDTVANWHAQAKAAGLNGVLAYTHFFATKGAHLKGLAMASCDTLSEADAAVDAGWRAAVTITDRKMPGSNKPQLKKIPSWRGKEYTTPKGRKVQLCPAQVGRRECNTCGLCDATNHPDLPIIGFLIH
jgi:uncharacterized protein YwbE